MASQVESSTQPVGDGRAAAATAIAATMAPDSARAAGVRSGDEGWEQARTITMEQLCVKQGQVKDKEEEKKRLRKDMTRTSVVLKGIRYATALVMFGAILISAVASKTSFFVVIFRLRNSLNATGVAKPLSTTQNLAQEAGVTFATLFLFLIIPHLFTLLWSFWCGFLGRKTETYPWPVKRAIYWGLAGSVLESLGMVLFILEACVDLPTPFAIALGNGVFFFSLVCPFKTFPLSYFGGAAAGNQDVSRVSEAAVVLRKKTFLRMIWILCLILQVSMLIAVPISLASSLNISMLHGGKSWRLLCLPLSVIFLSMSWSGFFQNKMNECAYRPSTSLYQTARWKTALITSGAKLVCTITFYFIFDEVFGYAAVKHMEFGFQDLRADRDMITAILVHVLCGLLAYVLICAACAMTLHQYSVMMPLVMVTPLCILLSIVLCDGSHLGMKNGGMWHGYSFCTDYDVISANVTAFVMLTVLWLTQVAYTFIFVAPVSILPLSREEAVFHSPAFNAMFLDQFTLLNWKMDHLTPPKNRAHRRIANPTYQSLNDDLITNSPETRRRKRKVYICSTMYREADHEQENLLKSIYAVHKAVQDNVAERDNLEFESHVFFDGAVRDKTYNDFVLQLFSLVETTLGFSVEKVDMLETPYGMQANWNMRPRDGKGTGNRDDDGDRMDGIRFTVHLKDGHKFKNKKRWSQVMYMSYVLDFCCRHDREGRGHPPAANTGGAQMPAEDVQRIEDTFILTTDADIVFSYSSVKALLDMMARDDNVGAVCARTHPDGNGPLVWYQIFDYAIGHWFQKTAEHVIGSVMCCPGCFSVFRCRALQDVLHIYSTKVEQATEFLTKDMGEDRWLCTLLVEKGWQLVYCAASENHTFCPESFDEFYKQRRRWIPSTLANLSLCVQHSARIVENNDAIGWWFIIYQALMIFSTVISPGTIIILMASGLAYAYTGFSDIGTIVALSLITIGFGIICVRYKKYEMIAAQLLTFVFAVFMVAVFVGVLAQMVDDSASQHCQQVCEPDANNGSYIPTIDTVCRDGYRLVVENCTHDTFLGAPIGATTLYLAALTSMFLVAGLSHPSEIFCLVHGVWYLLCLPSGYILLFVYSLCNMDSQSWGTREAKTAGSGGGGQQTWQDRIRGCMTWLRETFCESYPTGQGYQPVQQTDRDAEASRPPVVQTATLPDEQRPATLPAATGTAAAGAPINETQDIAPAQSVPPTPFPVQETTVPVWRRQASQHAQPDGGEAASSQQGRLPPQWSEMEDEALPCFLVDRTDIRTFLAKHQLEHLGENFEREGYDDAMFLVGMKTEEMTALGVTLSVWRSHLARDIKTLPAVPFEHGIPQSIERWLFGIGLPGYADNFRTCGYIRDGSDDDMEGIKELTKDKLMTELKITKRGHLKHLMRAIEFIRYPTERELRIKEVRQKISGRAFPSLDVESYNREELMFWEALKAACMKPEMAALGTNQDLAEKLIELRNASIMAVAIANILWIATLKTLAIHPELKVLRMNAVGLAFLLVYGIVYSTQFVCMLVHRLITIMHMLAAAKESNGFKADDNSSPEPIEDMQNSSSAFSFGRRHGYEPLQGDGGSHAVAMATVESYQSAGEDTV